MPGQGKQPDADEFYRVLDRLGGPHCLKDLAGCPPQGVYFFYEDGEIRLDGSRRVVRVVTHALTATSKASLRSRLMQHRGQQTGRNPGGGNHRASVFRRHVGAALIRREDLPDELLRCWLNRHRPPRESELASQEAGIEREVSRHIGDMPVLWLNVSDRTDRGCLESNSIALLANGPDLPSPGWLGRYAERVEIRESGPWNVQHVTDDYDCGLLRRLAQLVDHQQ